MRAGGEGEEGGNEALRKWYPWNAETATEINRVCMRAPPRELTDLIKNDCWRLPCRVMTGAAKRALKKGSANFQEEELKPSQHRVKRQKSKSPKEVKETPSAIYASEESINQIILLWWWLGKTEHVEEKKRKLISKRKINNPSRIRT